MLNAPMLGSGKTGRHLIVPMDRMALVPMEVGTSGTKRYGMGRFSEFHMYKASEGWVTGGYAGGIFDYGGAPLSTVFNDSTYSDSTNSIVFAHEMINVDPEGKTPLYVGCVETMKIQRFYPNVKGGYRDAPSKSLDPFFPTVEGVYHIFGSYEPITSFSVSGMRIPVGAKVCRVSDNDSGAYLADSMVKVAVGEGIVDEADAQRHWYVVQYDMSELGGVLFVADYEGTSFFGVVIKAIWKDSEFSPSMTYYCSETDAVVSMQGRIVDVGWKVGIYTPDLVRKTSQYAPFPLAKYAKAHITFTDNLVFE